MWIVKYTVNESELKIEFDKAKIVNPPSFGQPLGPVKTDTVSRD
jgi:hypothetical protein